MPDPITFRLQASRVLLTIAGHDPSSGAGITADLATFAAHGFFGTSAITALTAQSTLGILAVRPVGAGDLRLILQHLTSDLPPAGIKIGMLGAASIVSTVAAFLASDAIDPRIPIVLDPVLRSSSGAELLPENAMEQVHSELLTKVSWVTPNWTELAILSKTPKISTLPEAEQAMHHLGRRHPHLHIVATGGDQSHPTDLLRLPSGQVQAFPGDRIESRATHGTGCAFSSALLAALASGAEPVEAVAAAKHFVREAIRRAPQLGHGKGPMELLWPLRPAPGAEDPDISDR